MQKRSVRLAEMFKENKGQKRQRSNQPVPKCWKSVMSFRSPRSHTHQAGCPSGNSTGSVSLPLTQSS